MSAAQQLEELRALVDSQEQWKHANHVTKSGPADERRAYEAEKKRQTSECNALCTLDPEFFAVVHKAWSSKSGNKLSDECKRRLMMNFVMKSQDTMTLPPPIGRHYVRIFRRASDNKGQFPVSLILSRNAKGLDSKEEREAFVRAANPAVYLRPGRLVETVRHDRSGNPSVLAYEENGEVDFGLDPIAALSRGKYLYTYDSLWHGALPQVADLLGLHESQLHIKAKNPTLDKLTYRGKVVNDFIRCRITSERELPAKMRNLRRSGEEVNNLGYKVWYFCLQMEELEDRHGAMVNLKKHPELLNVVVECQLSFDKDPNPRVKDADHFLYEFQRLTPIPEFEGWFDEYWTRT